MDQYVVESVGLSFSVQSRTTIARPLSACKISLSSFSPFGAILSFGVMFGLGTLDLKSIDQLSANKQAQPRIFLCNTFSSL